MQRKTSSKEINALLSSGTQSIQIRHFAGMQWIVHLYVIPADQKKKVHTIGIKALSLNNVEYPSLARCDQ